MFSNFQIVKTVVDALLWFTGSSHSFFSFTVIEIAKWAIVFHRPMHGSDEPGKCFLHRTLEPLASYFLSLSLLGRQVREQLWRSSDAHPSKTTTVEYNQHKIEDPSFDKVVLECCLSQLHNLSSLQAIPRIWRKEIVCT